ncbi:MAG: UxaA family hydrolase [Deltaproteobacteria bacterium]|nr:UxaA family hydrolase [Deltaproteobacteria bacterium]
MTIDAIMIKETDNVATALRDIQPGEEVTLGKREEKRRFRVEGSIPYGHKFAVRDIQQGEDILKYGFLQLGGDSARLAAEGGHCQGRFQWSFRRSLNRLALTS